MAVSKRTRFEVLRRDNYACRYCRSTDNALTVDHVTPTALGGSDDPDNLVACCRDCNYGKASIQPDAQTVAQVSEDIFRWQTAMRLAALQVGAEREALTDRFCEFIALWQTWDEDLAYLPEHWADIARGWETVGVTPELAARCLQIAMAKRGIDHDQVFNYTRGIIRNKLAEIEERARALIERGEV